MHRKASSKLYKEAAAAYTELCNRIGAWIKEVRRVPVWYGRHKAPPSLTRPNPAGLSERGAEQAGTRVSWQPNARRPRACKVLILLTAEMSN